MDSSRLPLSSAFAALALLWAADAVALGNQPRESAVPPAAAHVRTKAAPALDPALIAAREEAARATEEAVRNAQHIESLEHDLRSLQELTRRNVVALEMMREQMDKARGERDTMAQIALVLGLLLAAVAGVLAWRSRNPAALRGWWSQRRALRGREKRQNSFAQGPSARTPAAAPDIDLSIDSTVDSAVAPVQPPPFAAKPSATVSRRPTSDLFAGNAATARLRKAEELIDVQQQADFFESIGSPDRAVAVLEDNLQQQAGASPLVWLDLLDSYHALGRRQDYERVRTAFKEQFRAPVADFDVYGGRQGGLESHGATLERIVKLWPSPGVLEAIQDALLRCPATEGDDALDLEAYRELVLLYNVASDLQQDETVVVQLARPTAGSTAGASPAHATRVNAAQLSIVATADLPRPSPQLGLDIDLDSLPPPELPLPDRDALDAFTALKR